MLSNIEIFEKVGPGHPDKIADYIADKFCSDILNNDHNAKVACEVLISNKKVIFSGEINTNLKLHEINEAQKYAVACCIYLENNLDYDVINKMQKQSIEIKNAVVLENNHIGAGDQGICIGMACDETIEKLPKVQVVANYIIEEITKMIVTGVLKGYGYDMKLLLTIDKDYEVKQVIFAIQHDKNIDLVQVRGIMKIILISLLKYQGLWISTDSQFIINGGGTFHVGGPIADTGLTGRKIACDNFACCFNGGGAFSGKDWTKVDRTGTYLARYIAKNILYHNHLKFVIVKLIYAIGQEYPKVYVNDKLVQLNLKPLYKIINVFSDSLYDLEHFTNNHWDQSFPWEKIDKKSTCWILKDDN